MLKLFPQKGNLRNQMNVSISFFNGVAKYSDAYKWGGYKDNPQISKDWVYHPLNWECGTFDHNFQDKCFTPAKIAQAFFAELLKPLEAHFGNCREALPISRYTWICPSNHDPDDVLTLHVNLNTLGFESKSKGTGTCWFNPGEHRWNPHVGDEEKSLTCEAWNPMEGTNRLLNFKLHAYDTSNDQYVTEYDDSQDSKQWSQNDLFDMSRNQYHRHNATFDSQFFQFVQNSQNLKKWVDEGLDSAMMKAFAAATESKPALLSSKSATPSTPCPEPIVCPTPEVTVCPKPDPVICPTPKPVDCPKCDITTTSTSGSQQSNGSTFGFMSGVIFGSVAAVSAMFLRNRALSQKKQAEPLPINQKHRIRTQAN